MSLESKIDERIKAKSKSKKILISSLKKELKINKGKLGLKK